MKQKLQFYLRAATNMEDAGINRILACFKERAVKKNTILLSEGEICKELYFVSSGCVRTYYLTKQGQEKTRHVAFENSVVTSMASFLSQQPSGEWVETVDDAELWVISHKDFYQLVAEIPQWEKLYRALLENAYIIQNKKMENRITLTAKERFDKVMNQAPQYMQRLSNKLLASWLDITQETLSRLKSR